MGSKEIKTCLVYESKPIKAAKARQVVDSSSDDVSDY